MALTNLAHFELDAQPDRMKYKMLNPKVEMDDNHRYFNGRYAFGGCSYNGKIYYFFGATGYNKQLKKR